MTGPHQGQPLVWAGRPVEEAAAAMVMVHGRGATAESILELRHEFAASDLAYVAPQAAGYTWYPYSFLAPMERNEPGLSSGLARIGEVLAGLRITLTHRSTARPEDEPSEVDARKKPELAPRAPADSPSAGALLFAGPFTSVRRALPCVP